MEKPVNWYAAVGCGLAAVVLLLPMRDLAVTLAALAVVNYALYRRKSGFTVV